MKRRLGLGTGGVASLPPEARRALIEVSGPLPHLQMADAASVTVDVTNVSPLPWPPRRVALSYHWYRADGSVWAFDGGRTPLPKRLKPGETQRLECTVRAPNTPAAYVLELDLVDGREGWFGAAGSKAARREWTVAGMRPESLGEIDYEQIYAGADLAKNYWSVSGPGSPEEFREISRHKAQLLKDFGLRPESRVLDVGCGTGGLADALSDFLGSEGRYYGTDLSEVAVQFCREKYARPNFAFAKNEMTKLPIDGLRFDFIVFFSVFTHTYPEETRQLLAEATRLLDEKGMILADVFESDIDADFVGTRAMMVLDRRRMVDMAEGLGLDVVIASEFSWDATGPRRIDFVRRRFTRRAAPLSV